MQPSVYQNLRINAISYKLILFKLLCEDKNNEIPFGFEVITAVTVKNMGFCVVISCSFERTRNFGGKFLFQCQGGKIAKEEISRG
jgi:hypothetical protein